MKSIALSSIILVLVLVARAAFVFPLSYLSNLTKKTPSEKISISQQVSVIFSSISVYYVLLQEYSCDLYDVVVQVIIWWAGLMRGAVSIALAYNKVNSFVWCICFRFEMHDRVFQSRC